MLLLLALLSFALLTACEDLPPLPERFVYEVDFIDERPAGTNRDAIVGWSVVAKGRTLGVITKADFGPRLTLQAPSQPSIESVFEGAELQSPCGKIIKLKKPIRSMWKDTDGKLADEKRSARKLYKFHLRDLAEKRPGTGPTMKIGLSAFPVEFPAGAHPVLIARGGVSSPLTIGPMTVELSVERLEVPNDCGDELPVRVGERAVGVWSSKSAATFIVLTGAACFAERVTGKILRGPGVFPLETDRELDSAPCP